MHVQILRHRLTPGYACDILTGGQKTHTAFTQILTLRPVLQIAQSPGDKVVLTIEKFWYFLGPDYHLRRSNKEYYFETVSWLRGHYRLVKGDDVYDIYAHDGGNYAADRNKRQVASWSQTGHVLGQTRYDLRLSDGEDHLLLIAFCIVLDHYNGGSRVRLLPESRPFNFDWQPS